MVSVPLMNRMMTLRIDLPWQPPLKAFAPFVGMSEAHLFHAGERNETARWSYLCAFPSGRVCVSNGNVLVNESPISGGINNAIRLLEKKSQDPVAKDGPSFCGGLAGYIGYEAASLIEPALDLPRSPYCLPDLILGRYDAVAIFDRFVRRLFVTGPDPSAVRHLADFLASPPEAPAIAPWPGVYSVEADVKADKYRQQVLTIRDDILRGDYFQANLSRRVSLLMGEGFSPFSLFRAINRGSTAAYGALLQFDGGVLISNSPERFFTLSPLPEPGGETRLRIATAPIKGTIQRHADPEADKAASRALESNEKDRAENIMIADLMRNDLSRICSPATISEDAICSIMSLRDVHHLVSEISGTLRDGLGVVDALAALFPCGSITGAPKIEAMGAISRYEGTGRGPYCGAIGFLDDRGGADLSVAIRTAIFETEEGRLSLPVGGGVTLLSDPDAEYRETQAKAQGFLAALERLIEAGRP